VKLRKLTLFLAQSLVAHVLEGDTKNAINFATATAMLGGTHCHKVQILTINAKGETKRRRQFDEFPVHVC
jgi:hypothetical protein